MAARVDLGGAEEREAFSDLQRQFGEFLQQVVSIFIGFYLITFFFKQEGGYPERIRNMAEQEERRLGVNIDDVREFNRDLAAR